jgi:hypothetical protein
MMQGGGGTILVSDQGAVCQTMTIETPLRVEVARRECTSQRLVALQFVKAASSELSQADSLNEVLDRCDRAAFSLGERRLNIVNLHTGT